MSSTKKQYFVDRKFKASSDFLKTKIWKFQTNSGDPKLFKLEKKRK